MFDPAKPYVDLPFLPPRKFDHESKAILKQLSKSKVELAKLDAMLRGVKNKELLLEPFAIREAVESSQVENVNTTVEDAYRSEFEPRLSADQKETLHYKEALLSGFELVKKRWMLTVNDYCGLGKILSDKSVVRTSTGVSIKKSSWLSEETVYTPPIWMNREGKDSISALLRNLEEFYNTDSDIDPLVKMALVHYQFEAIHPFYDGNGRTWRILMILYLILSRQLSYPALFLSGFINRHRSDYYALIMDVTTKGRWEEYVLFMLKGVEEQAKKTAEILEKLAAYMDCLETGLSKVEEMKGKYAFGLKELLSSKIFISSKDIEERLGVSKNTVTKIFELLVSGGFGKVKRIGTSKLIFNKELLGIFTR